MHMNLLTAILSFLLAGPFGNSVKDVNATQRIENVSDSTVQLVFDLTISDGWHVYSTALPSGGPTGASIHFDTLAGARIDGPLMFTGKELDRMDDVFGMRVRYFENKVTFFQNIRILDTDWMAEGALIYGACNDVSCLPPQKVEFSHRGIVLTQTAHEQSSQADLNRIDGFDAVTWAPVSVSSYSSSQNSRNLWGLFLTCFIGGLIALLTPCVWPVIPMTVSFFLKRSGSRAQAVRDGILYGLSIIAVYVAIGLAITLCFGANALNALATNAIVNIVFFLMLVAFALSFFGLFEIALPSSWSTGADNRAHAAGIGGIFFMALTLTLVSFSCTGPIIGFLLVDAASTGSILAPAIGMLGFSTAMAIPFGLFAMFPGWLQALPKSGSWMDRIKVTLAFIELAFSLKFLSVADMAYGWGILPRKLFVLLWALMALLLGIYLLGLFDRNKKGRPGMSGIITGTASLFFAVWLTTGLWGAPLKAISAFTPPLGQIKPEFTDFNEALAQSSRTGKPVLIDFSGYGCVNCRKMESAVWSDPRVSQAINGNYILTSLFVDDKTPLKNPVSIVENGTKIKIRTIGDKWSFLQQYKFGANAQPFYVIVDSQGRLVKGPYGFDADPDRFYEFLIEKE